MALLPNPETRPSDSAKSSAQCASRDTSACAPADPSSIADESGAATVEEPSSHARHATSLSPCGAQVESSWFESPALRNPERIAAGAADRKEMQSRRTYSDRPKRQPLLRHAEIRVVPSQATIPKGKHTRRHSQADSLVLSEVGYSGGGGGLSPVGRRVCHTSSARGRPASGPLTRSASFQPLSRGPSPSSDLIGWSGATPPDAEDFAFPVSAPAGNADAEEPTSGVNRRYSALGARRSAPPPAQAVAAAEPSPQRSTVEDFPSPALPSTPVSRNGSAGFRPPRPASPPTAFSSPRRSPNVPPSPVSARRAPPRSPPSASRPVTAPSSCLSISFSFPVSRPAPSSLPHDRRAADSATGGGSGGGGGGGGGSGGGGGGESEAQGRVLRSVSSQREGSRNLPAGQNIFCSSPNRLFSISSTLTKEAAECVAADSESACAVDDSACVGSSEGVLSSGLVQADVAVTSVADDFQATGDATGGGILRHGRVKRTPSFDEVSHAASATSYSPPASSPLSSPFARPISSAAAAGTVVSAAAAAVSPGTFPTLSPSRSLRLSPSPPPRLPSALSRTPSPRSKGGQVRYVSFCSMVHVRRFSACDADLRPAADAAVSALAEAEAAAAAMEAAGRAAAAREAAAAAAAAAEAAAAAAEESRVTPFSPVSRALVRQGIMQGSGSLTERPRHARTRSHSLYLTAIGDAATSPVGFDPAPTIRRTSSFQAAIRRVSFVQTTDPAGCSARGGFGDARETEVVKGNGLNDPLVKRKTPVPPRLPSPGVVRSPRVQRLLGQMWGDAVEASKNTSLS